MLSPQLLAILRTYWRLARPREWLYPGRHESKPIDVQVLHAACRSATKAAGLAKRVTVHTLRHSPHGELDEPRHASSGKRRRHPHHRGAFGPQQPVDNGTLYPDQVSPISGATPIAWRSPTADSWPWMRPRSGCAGATIGRTTKTS